VLRKGQEGETVGHHRFSIILGATAEIQEPTKNKQAPSDTDAKDKIAKHLKGLDIGNGYKVTSVTVDSYDKTPLP
jgi:hypothetical protein